MSTASIADPPVAPSPPADAPAGAEDPLRRTRLGLAALLLAAGVSHFLFPRAYESIVPRWAGSARFHVVWSGVVELVAGTLVAVPRTRRAGAWLALALLVAVYPANVQMAIDAGRPRDLATLAPWLRLPLQVPMWGAAWRCTR